LILDGQHRVYGFALAKDKKLRVPVVIYEGLSKLEEVTIFIDLNTKQKPVPNEFLLDIKKLAETENEQENFLNGLFDFFHTEKDSVLKGLTSPSSKKLGMISRVTFKSSFNPMYSKVSNVKPKKLYDVTNNYIRAFVELLKQHGIDQQISNPTILGGLMMLFPEILQKLKDKYDDDYSVENFKVLLEPIFLVLPNVNFKKPGNSKKEFYQKMVYVLKSNIVIEI